MPSYYRNEYLFSEIYLEEITKQPEEAAVLASLNVLQEYRAYADTTSLTTWKASYVHEVLSALGFNAVSKNSILTLLYPIGSVENLVSLCIIVLPGESLDNTTMGRNWAEKTIRALREQQLQWGLLTNGKQWRIYHVDEPTPYETYLEIDLESILQDKAKEAYQIFHKFMKSGNFATGNDGKCRFDRFKKESQDKIDYIEKELANALKQQEEGGKGVLSDICMGYVEALRQQGESNSVDDELVRKKVYHSAMLYMFRLLFLFYADARNLLSIENHALLQQVEQECTSRYKGLPIDTTDRSVWDRLEEIFVDIDQRYNGGLFSPHESVFTQFVEDTRIDDSYLVGPIFNLTTYRERDGQQRPISYRDMSVRHLGTLYEGLLEHKLFITKEPTEVKVSKGNIQFIPASFGGKMVTGHYLPTGRVYFGSDPSERKSTGSYYTPEYIVDYLVRNTVGHKLSELRSKFLSEQKSTVDALASAIDADEKKNITELLDENITKFVRRDVLQLSVLDPAMGSGHFLVNATNLISNSVTELLNVLDIESATPTGTAYWRRWVVENCIFGVDINPLAVELAKLSLWILSMARDQPLSFLNHHLKCGDSLVGARLEEVGSFPFTTAKKGTRQLSLFERDPDLKVAVEDAVRRSNLIVAKASVSLEDVEEKKAWLSEMEQALAGYKAICNVHTGLYFGNFVDESAYTAMVEKKDFDLAIALEKPNKYFHWELEYPEIFIARGGFSCIVCNPPYDTFRENSFFSRGPGSGTGNLYGHFIARAVQINKNTGMLGFVVPLSFACGDSYENLRKLVYQNYREIYASHFSIRPAKLFPGVDQRITLFYTEGRAPARKCQLYSSRLWRWSPGEEEAVVANPDLGFVGTQHEGLIPKVAGKIGADLYSKVGSAPMKLGSLIDGGNHKAHYHGIARYWIKSYDFIPHFARQGEASPSQSSTLGTVEFSSVLGKYLFLLLTNSSLFYYWWIARSDEFHLLFSDFSDFGVVNLDYFKEHLVRMRELVDELMVDYKLNSKRMSGNAGGKRISYDVFFPRKSLPIIHRIDDFVADAYGFDAQANSFLKSYDAEFRTDE